MSMQLSTGQATKKDSLALSLSLTPNQIQMLDRSMNNFRNSKDLRIDLGASINSQNIAEQLDLSQETNNLGLLNHPKYAQYFKRRVCVRYVPDPNTKLCMGCQQGIHEGAHKYIGNEWNYRTCTICQPTDAFGKLAFPGSHSKTASYIRVQNETKTKDMIQYLYSPEGWNLQRPQLILSVTGGAQKFTIPHRMKKAFKRGLIKAAASTGAWIITGGTNTGVMRLVGEAVADEFHTCNLTVLGIATWGKIAFREQMVKKSPRHIQATMNFEDLNKEAQQIRYNGTIYKKIIFNDKKKRMKKMLLKNLELENKLMYQTPLFYAQTESGNQSRSGAKPGANTDVLLDPNHTHFILVDDGSENQFGKEIEFRAHLEAELRKGRSLKYYESKRSQRLKKQQQQLSARSISLNRLETSQHSNSQQPTPQPPQQSDDDDDDDDEDGVKNESVPMILIVVQGGPNTLITVEQSLKQTVPVLILADSKGCADIIASACSIVKPDDSQLEKLIIESKMFEYFAKDPVAYQKKTNEAVERLKYIISRLSDNLINVFRLDSEEGGQDIELTILRAFLNSRKNKYYENLKLALQWNRDDIAKTDIFTGEEEFKSHQLANLMEMALLQNKPRFVELLLENGLNLKSFLTIRRLYFLYNSYKIQSDAKKAPLFQLYKKKYSSDHSASMITFRGLLRFLKEYLFEDFDPVFLPDDQDYGQVERFLHCANKKESSDVEMKDSTSEFNFGKNEVAFPEQNLFLWALFLNRIEIAIIFWQIGEHQICSALFASNLLKSMSYRLTDLEKELQKYANDFEQMAIGVLNIFDATTDDLINGVILLRKIPFFNLDCLQMAVEADCKKFVSLSSVQNLLTDIWYGKIASTSGLKASFKFAASILSLGFLAPFLVFSKREKLTHLSDRENTLKKLATYNKKKNISNLLRSYLTNNEINADTKEAHLLPRLCKSADDSSSSSSSSDSSDQDSSDDLEPQSRQTDSGACSGEVSEASPDESGSPSVHSLGAAESGAAGGGDADLAANRRRRRRRKRNKRSGVAKKRQSKWTTYWSRYLHFVHSPRVHFVYDALFYLVFLFLFSYWILCEFEYDELVEAWVSETSESGARLARSSLSSSGVSTEDFETSNRTNMTSSTSTSTSIFRSNLTSSWSNFSSTSTATRSMSSSTQSFDNMVFVTQRVVKYPSWIEWLLIYWMISFAAEEARQYFFGDAETKVLKNKLLHYFENNWNYLDISGCLVFSIGICLRFLAMSTGEALFVAARIVLCMDLCIWYVRILHVSVVFKSLGPKLVMIQKMIRDLMFFISIIAIFICAFGVTTQATLYPGRNKLDFELFKAILDKAYWPIYGEMKILDEMDRCEGMSADSMNDSSSLPCPETSGIAFSFIALMVYMVIANVLLINLLIAMFSSTFQDVQENTDQIWKFQRYRLVFEYYDSPILPPPLNFIAYFVALVHYLKQRSKLAAHRDTNTGVKTSASVTSSLAFEPPDDDKPENTAKDDVDLLLDRERKFAEEYVRMEKFRLKETTDSRLKITLEKLETLEQKLNEVIETRFKESNQLSVAINWIMSELDSNRHRAPYIQNLNLSRKGK